jgi:hypothetical protein
VQTGKTPAELAVARRFEMLIHKLCAKTEVHWRENAGEMEKAVTLVML